MPCSVNLNLSELRDGWEVTKGKQLGARKISAVGVSVSWALFWSCTTVAKPGRQKAPLPGLDWDRFVLFFSECLSTSWCSFHYWPPGAAVTFWPKGLRNPYQFMELPPNPRMPWDLPLVMPWTLGV